MREGLRDRTQDIASFKDPTELCETVINNKLPEGIILCFRSCLAKRRNCPKALEVKNCIWCFLVAYSCNLSLFQPSTSSPSPIMVPPKRQTHWARLNLWRHWVKQVTVKMNFPPLPLVHKSRRVISSSLDLTNSSAVLNNFTKKKLSKGSGICGFGFSGHFLF